METYKRQASENIIDHTRGIDQFQVDDVNDFEQYLHSILRNIKDDGVSHLLMESSLVKSNVTKTYNTNRYCKLTTNEVLVFNSKT